jgi:hypothetical protein
LDDIFAGGSSNAPAQQQHHQQQQQSTQPQQSSSGEVDLLSLFGGGGGGASNGGSLQMNSAPPAAAPAGYPDMRAYSKNGITAMFSLRSEGDFAVINATYSNSNPSPVNQFLFQAAVPKDISLKM